MSYTLTQFTDHIDQYKRDQLDWFRLTGRKLTKAETAAYLAGVKDGAWQAQRLLTLHAGFKFSKEKS